MTDEYDDELEARPCEACGDWYAVIEMDHGVCQTCQTVDDDA